MSSMHLYPMGKGDPLCPLGFHPQVRWPTRCKRCFRDYKEHGGKRKEPDLRKDDFTASTPSLGSFGTPENRRSWASSTNLDFDKKDNDVSKTFKNPSSWTSTPDLANLEDDTQANIPTVSLTLPLRRKVPPPDTGQNKVSETVTIKQEKVSPVFNKNDSLAARAKKLQALKENQSSFDRTKRIHIKEIKPTTNSSPNTNDVKAKPSKDESASDSSGDDDALSTAGTESTETTTLVDNDEFDLKKQLENLRQELKESKTKCERLEKEKSNILLRRLTAMDTTKGTSSEMLKLQQKVNELQTQLDDYKDEKKVLNLRVKELEDDLENRPTSQAAQKIADELRSKLLAAETLCEELMDENEDMKKELRDLEEEMEEMQDNFREDQADEYTSLKKELEQTTKNCRILSFKLRKTERKTEQLEQEKLEFEKKMKDLSGGNSIQYLDKIKQLEKDLSSANDQVENLQKKLDETNVKLSKVEENKLPAIAKKKAPMLGSLGKSASTDMKVSRESLTRGGSQDDPVQLLRDLQDSLEREADLREQLKFAEEEAETSRKKASRMEDDNESLVLQLKKMAARTTRTRKLTPTRGSEEEEMSDVKLQLELSEQEISVLRKKLEEFENDNDRLKKKTKELQEKLTAKPADRRIIPKFDKDGGTNEKIKILENEMNDIRKKLIEKERDCERLEAELNLSKKRSREMTKSKSQDLDQQTLDLKRQLQVIEQEANVFRNKTQTLEAENEKLIAENKKLELLKATKGLKADKSSDVYVDKIASLEDELEKANKKIKEFEDKKKPSADLAAAKVIKQLEKEKDKLQATLDKLKENSSKAFSNRKVHTPTDLTTKLQMKNMVNDLEMEISAVLVTLGNVETSKEKLEEELAKAKSSKGSKETSKELDDLAKKLEQSERELQKYKSLEDELQKKLTTLNNEKDKLKNDFNKLKVDFDKVTTEKKNVDEEINKLKAETSTIKDIKKDLVDARSKYETIKKEMEAKESEIKKIKYDLDEKSKASKELTLKTKKINELQKQIKDLEDENSRSEKVSKDKIKKLEDSLEEEKKKLQEKTSQVDGLISKQDKLSSEIKALNAKISELEKIISTKDKSIEKLQKDLEKERSETSVVIRGTTDSKELKSLREEVAKLKSELASTETKAKSAEKSIKELEDKLKKSENDVLSSEKKISDLDIDLQSERKKVQVMKTNSEKEQKNKELELVALKNKIKTLELNSGSGNKKITEIRLEYQEKIEKLEKQIEKEKKEYDTLTAKYEVLEEEHVVTKAKLVTDKESLGNQLMSLRRENDKIQAELEELEIKHNALVKEKNELIDKLKKGNNNDTMDKARLKVMLDERQSDIEQLKKEIDYTNDQMEYMRRENDELKKKLDDYEKVSKIQRTISADSSSIEREIRELKQKCASLEKSKKSDLSELKMRYESQQSVLGEEMQSMQNQVSRFKRERDNYKHMLESAQKTIGDLKVNPGKGIKDRNSFAGIDDLEEYKSKIQALEQQISCMEDELSESRLEASKLKTELVSDRSSWEVKMSEMQSRVNELEEEKILSSGRTKIAGLRTRMELSWQKEREEQQRLLQETATLARDLRQTLFEVERERDKEVLEAKRKMEQLRKTLEEDQEENKKKLTELQCDFMELRDAHAKLRTTNEKLRREKERHEKEREEMRFMISGRRRSEQEDFRKVNMLVKQVEHLLDLAPELFGSRERDPSTYTPTPPKRTKSKSRESSPGMERKDYSRESSVIRDEKKTQVQSTLLKLVEATDELKRMQRLSEEDRERDRMKRNMGMRRATSTENEPVSGSTNVLVKKVARTDSNLQRKSLSLEHTASMHDHNIWKGGDDDSLSSMQSLDMGSDLDFRRKRDASLDSRLSSGSTQSELASGEKKKKKSLMGKLKKLTKSRSIDDQDNDHFSPTHPLSSKPGSNSDVNEDVKGSKKDLKDRITGMFKRAGSSSRSNSVERQVRHDTSSTQRPLMRNGSNSNLKAKDSSTDKLNTVKKSAKI